MATRFEWSVMAMYFSPRCLGRRGHLLDAWPCRRSRWCACADRRGCRPSSISSGSSPASAQSNSRRASRSSGGKQGRSERGVDLLLGAAGDLLLAAEDAVLVDLQPAVLGQAAQHDVVLLRAGEVLQGRPERLGRHDAQIDLQAAGQPDRHLRVAAEQHLSATPGTRPKRSITVARRRRPRPASRGRRPSPCRGGSCRPASSCSIAWHCRRCSRIACDLPSASAHRIRCSASAAMSSPSRMACFGLGAEALQLADALLPRRPARSSSSVVDAQLVVEHGGPLRPQPGHAQHGQHAFGDLGQQFVEHRQRAGLDQRGHLLGQVLADARRCRSARGPGRPRSSATDSGRSRIARAPLR